ncbi:MAG: hypothetical protein R3C19_18325 [Planctomycetaceae bacterium]
MSERESEPNNPDPKADWSETAGAAGGSTARRGLPTPQLLQQIIAAADEALHSADQDVELQRELDAVGRRFPQAELTVEPVLLAMVDTVISRMKYLGPKLGPKVTEFVATTLYDDPVARVRVERLWAGVRGRANHE